MVYKIKFICDEVEGFVREIEIDSNSTFLTLNKAILESCGYPDDQMTSFYVCDEEWMSHEQITREDVSDADNKEEDIYVMEKTPLDQFINDEGQRFEFVFDPFSERSFALQVKEIIPSKHIDGYAVVRQVGEPPKQVEELDLSFLTDPKAGKATSNDVFDDNNMYGDEGYNEDEIASEGLGFSDEGDY